MPKNMFTVKAVSAKGDKKQYREVGVAFINEGEKGTSIKIALHMFPGLELVAFPVEAKGDAPAGE
jgi:hypothetical protein